MSEGGSMNSLVLFEKLRKEGRKHGQAGIQDGRCQGSGNDSQGSPRKQWYRKRGRGHHHPRARRHRGKKAFVLEDDKLSLSAKEPYAQVVLRELPQDRLVVLLELAVRLLQEDAE